MNMIYTINVSTQQMTGHLSYHDSIRSSPIMLYTYEWPGPYYKSATKLLLIETQKIISQIYSFDKKKKKYSHD